MAFATSVVSVTVWAWAAIERPVIAIGSETSGPEARASYVAGAGASKDQLEEFVADEPLGLIDHYRIVRGALFKGFSAATELGDGNALSLLAGGCTRISGIVGV